MIWLFCWLFSSLQASPESFREADARARAGQWTQEEKEWVDFVAERSKGERFDGDEAAFHPEYLQNPLEILGIVETEKEKKETEEILRTCAESGDYEKEFLQTLTRKTVSVSKTIKLCEGHRSSERIKGSTQEAIRRRTEKRAAALKKSFDEDPLVKQGASVATYYHRHYGEIISHFHHQDNVPSCDRFQTKILAEDFEEQEIWESEDPQGYANYEQNPHCRKSAARLLSPTKRSVVFHCAPDHNSPCAPFRAQGAVLVRKECLERDEESGDCLLWKKTFDCGRSSIAQSKHEYREGKRKIYGLNGEFNTSYDHSTDFPKVFAILKSLSDMPLGEGAKIFDLTEDQPIFNGKARQCSCNHMVGELYDCCKTMSGAIPCTDKEKSLRKMNDEGRCHQVGSYREGIFGNKKIRTFCCYPTKLLRIFNEQARKQMGRSWGSAKKPDCSGFSLNTMESLGLDVSLFDFSEDADALTVDEKAVMEAMAKDLREALDNPAWRHWE